MLDSVQRFHLELCSRIETGTTVVNSISAIRHMKGFMIDYGADLAPKGCGITALGKARDTLTEGSPVGLEKIIQAKSEIDRVCHP